MDGLFGILGLAIVSSILIVFLQDSKVPGFGVVVSVFAGALIFLQVFPKVVNVISVLEELSLRVNLNKLYLATIFKVIGISYMAEFGAQVCRDAGQGAIATKVEFAGKILVLMLAMPIIAAILETVVRLLP